MRELIKLVPGLHYRYQKGYAATLPAEAVSKQELNGLGKRTHDSGWTISGSVFEDYVQWVNDFEATHPIYGTVRGNFEGEVFASSYAAFFHFIEHHPYEVWDYHDI